MGKPRPILLRFYDYRLRQTLWATKRGLKDTGITLSEFLTISRHAVFVEARKRLGVKDCWILDGKVVVICSDGTKKKVTTMTELSDFKACKPMTSDSYNTATGSSSSRVGGGNSLKSSTI